MQPDVMTGSPGALRLRGLRNDIFTQIVVKNRELAAAVMTTSAAAAAAIISSLAGMGVLATWPILVLFFIFVKNYNMGLLCFVLSFAYQAPVIFIPQYGLSAYLRLDEMIFGALFLAWLARKNIKSGLKNSTGTLRHPLLFYVFIAVFSLLARYDQIGSTAFLNSASGAMGLVPLIFKAMEMLLGYVMLSDKRIKPQTRKNLFICLPIAAGFAVLLGFLIGHGFLAHNIVTGSSYDPTEWYTRLSLYGNTSAWGVLLAIYFFILLYAAWTSHSRTGLFVFSVLLILCVEGIFISGTKTSFLGILCGLVFVIFSRKRTWRINIKIMMLIFITVALGIICINQFATPQQKGQIERQMEDMMQSMGLKDYQEGFYEETSLGSRASHWTRFANAVSEEPSLLITGRGWHRRVMYETGVSLHNDILTACHDMGIAGVIFVVWFYLAMYHQFRSTKAANARQPLEIALLKSMMYAILILLITSSFVSENLTFYSGIDVQFSFVVIITAIVHMYINQFGMGETQCLPTKQKSLSTEPSAWQRS